MGGPGDPSRARAEVIFDILRFESAPVPLYLVAHGLARLPCFRCLCVGDDTPSNIAIWPAVHSHCDQCLQNIEEFGIEGTCISCSVILCRTCVIEEAEKDALVDKHFFDSFAEFAHLRDRTSTGQLAHSFADGVRRIATENPTALPPFELKPPLPVPLDDDQMDGSADQCLYSEDGYVSIRKSWVFSTSFARRASVFGLNCSHNH